jgi:hypothetical protein
MLGTHFFAGCGTGFTTFAAGFCWFLCNGHAGGKNNGSDKHHEFFHSISYCQVISYTQTGFLECYL